MKRPVIICIVDDDDVYQFTFTRTLKTSNISKRILVFSDGEEAIEFFEANTKSTDKLPDVVFLDINMPIMDGWDFLEEYVKLKPSIEKKITIYVVSSSVHPEDIERATKISEVSDYLIKPVSADETRQILDKVVTEIE